MNKVHGVLLSPFVRKVMLTLDHKNVAYENIPTMPGSKNAHFRAINPLGKVPVYEDEYVALPDSSVICQYLDGKYRSPGIYPSNPAEKAKALWLEEFADSKLTELLGGGLFYELLVAPKMLGRATDQHKVNATIKALPPFLDYLERHCTSKSFLVAGQISIADFSIPSMFVNAQYAGYEVDKVRWPRLHAYLQFIFDHPLYQKRFAAEKDIVAGLGGKK